MLLSLKDVSKRFGTTQALDRVSLDLAPGEVHALMGENGAGKSTLIRVLAGVTTADSGEIAVDGRPAALASPAAAEALGLRFVHQELNIVPALSVAENILLGHRYPRRLGVAVDWDRMNALAAEALARLGVGGIDVRTRAGRLGTGEQILVVLAGMLVSSDPAPRIFVMDEPTAALTHAEADRLFGVIRELRDRGAAILYVSHRLGEVMALADRVTVLRDGRTVMTRAIGDTAQDGIIRAMTGRDLRDLFPPRTTPVADEIKLEVAGLRTEGVHGIDLSVRAGEILGLAGLEGAGQSELLAALAGARRREAGRVRHAGRPGPRNAHAAWRSGVAYVPRERRREGLMLGADITRNTVLPHLGRLSLGGILARPGVERRLAGIEARKARLRFDRLGQPVRTLSGGNQQKVLFARAMAGGPDVLLLDEPSRGVDVGARRDIFGLIRDFAARGGSVVMTSTDLTELLGLCDRILVLRDGRRYALVGTKGLDEASLLALIYGDAAGREAVE